MGKNTGIGWTDNTWNPFQGCRKISPGCKNCYMYREKNRFGQDPENIIRSSPATFNSPLKWKDKARVFVCSWSDFFIEEADPWRGDAWDIIRKTPHLIYQILTKRPHNIESRLPEDWPLKNVWLGVTAENQEQYNARVPIMASIESELRFVSIEPMLDKILLFPWQDHIDWIICGGESAPKNKLRNMDTSWCHILLEQCRASNTAFFMKQMSGATKNERMTIPGDLNIREFPK